MSGGLETLCWGLYAGSGALVDVTASLVLSKGNEGMRALQNTLYGVVLLYHTL